MSHALKAICLLLEEEIARVMFKWEQRSDSLRSVARTEKAFLKVEKKYLKLEEASTAIPPNLHERLMDMEEAHIECQDDLREAEAGVIQLLNMRLCLTTAIRFIEGEIKAGASPQRP